MTEVALKDSMPLYFSDYNPFSSPACLPLDTVEMLPVYDSLSCVPITQRGGVSDLTMGLLQFHQSPPDFLVNTLWLWEWLWVGSRQGRLAPWALFRAHKLGLVKEIRRDGGRNEGDQVTKAHLASRAHRRPVAHKRPRGLGQVRMGVGLRHLQ